MVAEYEQDEDEEQDGDGVPGELVVDVGRRDGVVVALGALSSGDIEAIDHDQAEDREQRRDREQEGVGVRRAPAHHDVGDEGEDAHDCGGDPEAWV